MQDKAISEIRKWLVANGILAAGAELNVVRWTTPTRPAPPVVTTGGTALFTVPRNNG